MDGGDSGWVSYSKLRGYPPCINQSWLYIQEYCQPGKLTKLRVFIEALLNRRC